MMYSLSLAMALSTLINGALANIYITNPVAASIIVAGANFTVTWQADPDLALPRATSFGMTNVGLYTGSINTQTRILSLGQVADPVGGTNRLSITIPATAGPNSAEYFIRFDSANSTLAAPIQAFSARFTMQGMTGTFTPEAIAQNAALSAAGDSTAAPSTAVATTRAVAAATTAAVATTSRMLTSSASATANATSSVAAASSTARVAGAAQNSKSMGVAGLVLMGVVAIVA